MDVSGTKLNFNGQIDSEARDTKTELINFFLTVYGRYKD